jgi:hypothetical protein
MAVGDAYWANPYGWSDSAALMAAANAQQQNENLQAALLGNYVRQMAGVDYQMAGIPAGTARNLGDFMNSMADRGTATGGTALRGLGDVSSAGVGNYLNPLMAGANATGQYTNQSASGYNQYGNALNQSLVGGASNTAQRYLGYI